VFNAKLNTNGIELDIKKGFQVDFSTRFRFEICSLFGFEPGKYGEGHYEIQKYDLSNKFFFENNLVSGNVFSFLEIGIKIFQNPKTR